VPRLGVACEALRNALRSGELPPYDCARGPWADAFEAQIPELLAPSPRMPVTVLAGRIGWSRGLTVEVRCGSCAPLFVPPDPVQRTEYAPGELAQGICGFRR